ncbi:MAG: hypothetical protein DME83_06240, partial [Verrucomicrobia bacterium]
GAWDGDPDRHIISYQTAIAQTLLGHKLGEVISLNTDHDTTQFAIVSINPVPPDKTESTAAVRETPAIEVAISE